MIDHTLMISPAGAILFHLKQGFWLYAWPMLIGFVTILGYQALGRVVMMGTLKWPIVFGLGSVVSMVSLLGWVMMVRGMNMIPFYGCGVGLASAMMSRVYAITLPVVSMKGFPRLKVRILRITWRGDAAGIELLQQALKARKETLRENSARSGAL